MVGNNFKPDLTPKKMRMLGILNANGILPIYASQKKWPKKWVHQQDPGGWGQWYDRYSAGRRTEDDNRQIKRWLSFKARHGSSFEKNPTPRRAFALMNWGIDPLKLVNKNKLEAIKKSMELYKQKHENKIR